MTRRLPFPSVRNHEVARLLAIATYAPNSTAAGPPPTDSDGFVTVDDRDDASAAVHQGARRWPGRRRRRHR